jgi:hypothetical protein
LEFLERIQRQQREAMEQLDLDLQARRVRLVDSARPGDNCLLAESRERAMRMLAGYRAELDGLLGEPVTNMGRRIEVPADAVEDLDELQGTLRQRMAQACACGAGSLCQVCARYYGPIL